MDGSWGGRMTGIVEFDDPEPALVHVKVDVSPVEARGVRFPHLRVGMGFLDFQPGAVSDAAVVHPGRDKEEGERVSLRRFIDHHHGAADPFAVRDHVVGHGVRGADRFVDILVGRNEFVGRRPECRRDAGAKSLLQAAFEGGQVGVADAFEGDPACVSWFVHECSRSQ